MNCRSASLVLLCFVIVGCVQVPQDDVDKARYQYDRTLTLDDIAPIVPAFVKRPYTQCERGELKNAKVVKAKIHGPRHERVYELKGIKCLG